MHTPKVFDQTDVDAIHELIEAHPLGALVTSGPDGITANHVPFQLVRDDGAHGALLGHVARANPVWRAASSDMEVLVIFQGVDRYVSPGWYPTKREHGKVVPTWNYVVAHAYGKLTAIDDRDWLRTHVERMTDQHEASAPEPWSVDDAPAAFTDRMLKAIVGIRVRITRFEAKWKVSQNRPAADRAGVADALRREGDPDSLRMADRVGDER